MSGVQLARASDDQQQRRARVLVVDESESRAGPDPAGSDARYDAALTVLRERTRDLGEFRLLASENADYGFRRNTLGLRPYGLASAAVVPVGSILVFLLSDESTGGRLGSAGPAAAWSLGMILFFGLVVRPSWVRVPAEAYAERLVGAAEALRGEAAAARQP